MVGKTEDQLTEAGIPYEAGIAQYKELARGQLLGDDIGMLKLLIHQETHQILGVHAIGTNATELIHIGQAVMAFNGTVDYFINNVFNLPHARRGLQGRGLERDEQAAKCVMAITATKVRGAKVGTIDQAALASWSARQATRSATRFKFGISSGSISTWK